MSEMRRLIDLVESTNSQLNESDDAPRVISGELNGKELGGFTFKFEGQEDDFAYYQLTSKYSGSSEFTTGHEQATHTDPGYDVEESLNYTSLMVVNATFGPEGDQYTWQGEVERFDVELSQPGASANIDYPDAEVIGAGPDAMSALKDLLVKLEAFEEECLNNTSISYEDLGEY